MVPSMKVVVQVLGSKNASAIMRQQKQRRSIGTTGLHDSHVGNRNVSLQ